MNLKWYHYIICFFFIILGGFCCVNLFELFSVSSKEYGTAITVEKKNDYLEVSKFDLGTLILDSEDYVNFSYIGKFEPTDFNGQNDDYLILFNGSPLNNLECKSGKISGIMSISFFDLNGEKITTSELNISIEYYASGTTLSITSVNTDDSIAYLTAYTNINGVIIKVVSRG